jgi:RNA polymerase sigma-70 factor (ECF subfamily)
VEGERVASTSSLRTEESAAPDPARLPAEQHFHEIAQAIRAGDSARYEEIVNLFRDRVYRIAWRIAQNAEDALDITQEVFLRAFRALGSWHGRARFSTWLHRIAVNASIDFIRRQAKHRDMTESLDDMAPERLAAIERRNAPAEQPRRQAYASELRREIHAAVRRLPSRQRRSFVLRYYHECSIREISAVMAISEGAVKRHLYRAARRLRVDLAARLGADGGIRV